MALPTQYASIAQLEVYWRPLSEAEQTRAFDLLGKAATLINEIPGAKDDAGELTFSRAACEHICLDMVKRAMVSRGDGVVETTATMADMSGSVRHLNPVGNLYLTAQEIARLVRATPCGSLTMTSNARVPQQPWNYQPSSQTD